MNKPEPAWLSEALDNFRVSVNSFEAVAKVVRSSLSAAEVKPRMTKSLALSHDAETARYYSQPTVLEEAIKDAAVATRERESDYQTLLYTGLLLHWASLETFTEDVMLGAVRADPGCLSTADLTKVKLSIADMLVVDELERTHLVVRALERHVGADLRSGVTRFEPLLSLIGLAGATRHGVAPNIYEAQKIRNLIAHRRGRVDARFVADCPRVNAVIGQQLRIPEADYFGYFRSIIDYVQTIHARATRRFGGVPKEGWEDLTVDPWAI